MVDRLLVRRFAAVGAAMVIACGVSSGADDAAIAYTSDKAPLPQRRLPADGQAFFMQPMPQIEPTEAKRKGFFSRLGFSRGNDAPETSAPPQFDPNVQAAGFSGRVQPRTGRGLEMKTGEEKKSSRGLFSGIFGRGYKEKPEAVEQAPPQQAMRAARRAAPRSTPRPFAASELRRPSAALPAPKEPLADAVMASDESPRGVVLATDESAPKPTVVPPPRADVKPASYKLPSAKLGAALARFDKLALPTEPAGDAETASDATDNIAEAPAASPPPMSLPPIQPATPTPVVTSAAGPSSESLVKSVSAPGSETVFNAFAEGPSPEPLPTTSTPTAACICDPSTIAKTAATCTPAEPEDCVCEASDASCEPEACLCEACDGGACKLPSEPRACLCEASDEAQPLPVEQKPESKPFVLPKDLAAPVIPNPVAMRAQPPATPSPRAVALLQEANTLASRAASESEFSEVVQRCRHVLAIDRSAAAVTYSKQLAAWAFNKRGELRADAGRSDEAMIDFDDALQMDPQRWRAVHNRGVILAQRGDYAEAFDAFNQTITLNADFAKAYSNRAALYVQAGDLNAALRDYGRAIGIDPDLAVAHKGRGRVCHMIGKMEDALRHFDAAMILAPGDAQVASSRADLLMDMGRYAEATQSYRHAITLNPTLPTPYRNLAWLQATCPNPDYRNGAAAVENAAKAIELSAEPDDISLDTLAAAQAATGDFEAAVGTIEQAIAVAPIGDATTYAERLALYERGKDFTTAPVAAVQQATYYR